MNVSGMMAGLQSCDSESPDPQDAPVNQASRPAGFATSTVGFPGCAALGHFGLIISLTSSDDRVEKLSPPCRGLFGLTTAFREELVNAFAGELQGSWAKTKQRLSLLSCGLDVLPRRSQPCPGQERCLRASLRCSIAHHPPALDICHDMSHPPCYPSLSSSVSISRALLIQLLPESAPSRLPSSCLFSAVIPLFSNVHVVNSLDILLMFANYISHYDFSAFPLLSPVTTGHLHGSSGYIFLSISISQNGHNNSLKMR